MVQMMSHPEFLLEQKTCGGIPEEYFDIGEQMLLKKPDWLVTKI